MRRVRIRPAARLDGRTSTFSPYRARVCCRASCTRFGVQCSVSLGAVPPEPDHRRCLSRGRADFSSPRIHTSSGGCVDCQACWLKLASGDMGSLDAWAGALAQPRSMGTSLAGTVDDSGCAPPRGPGALDRCTRVDGANIARERNGGGMAHLASPAVSTPGLGWWCRRIRTAVGCVGKLGAPDQRLPVAHLRSGNHARPYVSARTRPDATPAGSSTGGTVSPSPLAADVFRWTTASVADRPTGDGLRHLGARGYPRGH